MLLMTLVMGFLIGAVLFLGLPIITDSRRIGDKFIWLATKGIKRGALVMQEEGKLNWKKLKYESIGTQKVNVNGGTVLLSDPGRSIKSFSGGSLALADEIHGVIFSVSDAIAGLKQDEADSVNRMVNEATEEEKGDNGIYVWIRKYLHIPVGKSIDLRDVRRLATGNTEGTNGEIIETYYKNSRIQELRQTSIWKLLLIPASFVAVLLLIWQSAGSGSSTTKTVPDNETVVSILFVLTPVANMVSRKAKLLAGIIALIVGTYIAYLIVGYWALLFIFAFVFGLIMGLLLVGGSIIVLCVINAGGLVSTLLLGLGLQTYDNPTIVESSEGYRIEDGTGNGEYHKLGKHRIYFTIDSGGVRDRDGFAGTGSDIIEREEQLNAKYTDSRQDWFGWYIPESISRKAHYITATDAFQSLAYGFIGINTDKKLKESKEKYGNGIGGVGEFTIIGAIMVSIVLAVITGWVFYL